MEGVIDLLTIIAIGMLFFYILQIIQIIHYRISFAKIFNSSCKDYNIKSVGFLKRYIEINTINIDIVSIRNDSNYDKMIEMFITCEYEGFILTNNNGEYFKLRWNS